MSDKTDEEQREAEKKAGKELHKAKEALKKIKKTKEGSGDIEHQRNAEILKKKLKKKLNRLKGELANRDYQAADDTIDDIRAELDQTGVAKGERDDLDKALDAIEKIKDEELWISPSVDTTFCLPDATEAYAVAAREKLSTVPLEALTVLDPSEIRALNSMGVSTVGELSMLPRRQSEPKL